jgi:hypothetical protein
MLMIAMVIGCLNVGGGSTSPDPVAAMEWSEGMWQGFAMTVTAGVNEAISMADAGDRDGAIELLVSVYHGSFEPELEVAIREYLGAQNALELEFAFEMLRGSLGRRDVTERSATLYERLSVSSQALDALEAVLEK